MCEMFVSTGSFKRRAFEHLAGHEKQDRDSAAGRSKPKKGVGRLGPEDFELVLSEPLLTDGFVTWPLWETNTVGFVPGTLITSAVF
jgi:hypothetical protein